MDGGAAHADGCGFRCRDGTRDRGWPRTATGSLNLAKRIASFGQGLSETSYVAGRDVMIEQPVRSAARTCRRSRDPTGKPDRGANVSDLRYASLKRYLAKGFHPDYAPGQGIEKIVGNEIFKEIWNEIERLDQGVSATRFATGRSSSAA